MKRLLFLLQLFFTVFVTAQTLPEQAGRGSGNESFTYEQTIRFYEKLAAAHPECRLLNLDTTDAAEPLRALVYNRAGHLDPSKWEAGNKLVLLVLNGIHAGEPDGIDASVQWLQSIVSGKQKPGAELVLVIVPAYNIGGMKNRTGVSRVNQNGPLAYGFRGNSQNLDLNRDFIKAESRETAAFARLFHLVKPHLFIDNHVSDGADYQHTLTILSTQHNKLGGRAGVFLNKEFEPAIYKALTKQQIFPIPYVNFNGAAPDYWPAFYDAPRYSCGYTSLWGCIGFTTETHMLKPFPERVKATLTFMQTVAALGEKYRMQILENARKDAADQLEQSLFPLHFRIDTSLATPIIFQGYAHTQRKSNVTGRPVLFYDHDKPYTDTVSFFNHFEPADFVKAPQFYYLSSGFYKVADRLKQNGINMKILPADTTLLLRVQYIKSYETSPLFEGHRRNVKVETRDTVLPVKLFKGDYQIPSRQPGKRYLAEMLHPRSNDGFFAWNFFDAVLQQKEYYADYRFEPVAERLLSSSPAIKKAFEQRRQEDSKFAENGPAQLEFIYRLSPYYEPVHMRYPVFQSLN